MNSSMTQRKTMSMSSCLNESDPIEALMMLSSSCADEAISLANNLSTTILPDTSSSSSSSSSNSSSSNIESILPKSLRKEIALYQKRSTTQQQRNTSNSNNIDTTNLSTAIACAESISSSLVKIALGGSRASEEMRALEKQRLDVNVHIMDIEDALRLRQLAALGAEALGGQRYADASYSIRDFRSMIPLRQEAVELAGRATMQQLKKTEEFVQQAVLQLYEEAVKEGNVAKLSHLTPLLGILSLANKGVGLYLRYLQKIITDELIQNQESTTTTAEGKTEVQEVNACKQLAKIFNVGVMVLRHHLPMVASALGDADGDAALLQLVHLEVEKRAVQVITDYSNKLNFASLNSKARALISRIEDRYGAADDYNTTEDPVAEFNTILGCTLSTLDTSLDEAALLLQHTESYERFIRHAVSEVAMARELRNKKKQRLAMEAQKAQQAKKATPETTSPTKNHETKEEQPQQHEKKTLEILPKTTLLNDVVAEFGGHYSGLEHVLLLGSMQRAFHSAATNSNNDTIFSPVSILSPTKQGGEVGSKALQTSLVEECYYAAQRSTTRAFATGHSGTASAAANFCGDVLGRTLLQILISKANTSTNALKALLIGSVGGLSQAAMAVIGSVPVKNLIKTGATSSGKEATGKHDELQEQAKIELGIARSCAFFNDLEVAMEYSKRLETQFLQEIDASYPQDDVQTEQLRSCVKNLGPVRDSFKTASVRNMEQFSSLILPKVRSIVNDAVGLDKVSSSSTSSVASSATTFMGAVAGGGVNTASASSQIRMNYNLDEDGYELAQVTEGYMTRLCSALEDLIKPLRVYLMPHLSDILMIEIIGATAKRLESAIRRVQFSILGAIKFDADVRNFLSYAKRCLISSSNFASNVAIYKACVPLARLSQIALLMNVDDLEDVLDLIASSKRKGNWDLKIDDAKAFLSLRVDFEGKKVNELLRISEE